MSAWATKVFLNTDKEQIETDEIKYLNGILQGDLLNLILFILSVNPLSFLLEKCDDLKLFARNLYIAKQLLDIVTTFSKDINMQFGVDKCAFMYIEREKRKSLGEMININGVEIKELEEGDMYKYLGQDESVGYNGPVNKERVSKEYLKRVKKIWNSQLSAINKSTAHNVFAVPIMTPTIGILDWTRKEIEDLDIKRLFLFS